MKVTGLEHKHGGKITDVLAIGHDTYKRVGSWHYVCRVVWEDGSVSESAVVEPWAVVYDHENEAAQAEYRDLSKKLDGYLRSRGEWLQTPKVHPDGRVVHWVAHQPTYRLPL